MIIRAKYGGDVELRSAEFGTSVIPPPGLYGFSSYAGEVVTLQGAVALPAALAAMLLTADTLGSLPMIVYRGTDENRARARDSYQWRLLHDSPGAGEDPVNFFSDVAMCIEGCGNAYVRKLRAGRKIVALQVLDPMQVVVQIDRNTGEKSYRLVGPAIQEIPAGDVIHLRGPTLHGGIIGLSPIQLCRNAFGTALAKDKFEGRFYSNSARPGLVFKFGADVDQKQAEMWLDMYNVGHQGPENAGRATVLGGGAEVEVIPVSLADAQFVESQNFSVLQVARIFRMPAALLDAQTGSKPMPKEDLERWYKLGLAPRMRRIEAGFAADPEMFAGTNLYPEFLADALVRGDIQTRYLAYKDARQGSWITANEIRRMENMPAIEGGDEIQVTPVGGAPNPSPAPEPGSAT